ncbi:hypothetical protein CTA2_8967 [Colletotrichum tanaceti]|uniref:Uncharacterized protein n=1 Tax=Colletotrichum tanaceti TaxID=1306861 RepID=A0A4U6XK41_9PEZI|nr:hypothetical protein CTA2_8967 [Colletotrichum tanaceti]TKW56184.1 hypothetical protein CTA1_6243 [Colletotrichum tanaceti]
MVHHDNDGTAAELFSRRSQVQLIPSPGAALAMIVLPVLAWYYLRSWYRLRHIPGPFLNSISIAPMNYMALGGKLSLRLKELGDRLR